MDADIDLIVRSRPTILEILENRGYNVDSYKDMSPTTILKLATTNAELLKIVAPKVPDGLAPMERAVVLYWIEPVRIRLEAEIMKLWNEENPVHYNPVNDDIIVLISEPFHEVFHQQAAKVWGSQKGRISFFSLKHVISNPARHIMVPPHRKLTADEVNTLMKGLHLKSRSELPHIKFHVDMQARVLGLVPGDIVEICRPSETCGEHTMYRVCSS